MSEIITVGLDLAKDVFQVHGADGGAPGLEAALVALWGEDLPIQRCTVHKHRNLLGHPAVRRDGTHRGDCGSGGERIEPGLGGAGSQILATWTAAMSGGHWGHLHRRLVTYRGLVDVTRQADRWVLDGLSSS